MPELSIEQAEELIKANSISCPIIKSGYLNDLPKSTVLYIETANDVPVNQMIAKNLVAIQKIYAVRNQTFLYLPQLLQDGADIFQCIYPGMPLNQSITPENITSTITVKLLTELGVSSDVQGAMLLTYSDKDNPCKPGWVITRVRCNMSAGQFFQTHTKMYAYQELDYAKHSEVLHDNFYETDSTDPEQRFDNEVNRIVSEIDERINFLKKKGLFRLLSDTIAPMLTPKLSRLCITEDFRIFLPDYNNLEITMNPLSKVVYFLFLRHPEGIFLKNLPLYSDELTQIYRLLSNRENLQDMDESIRKLTDPSDNSIYEKYSRIKRSFLQHISNDLAESYYIKGYTGQPKQIILSRTLIDLPDALKSIRIPEQILMDIMVAHTCRLFGR